MGPLGEMLLQILGAAGIDGSDLAGNGSLGEVGQYLSNLAGVSEEKTAIKDCTISAIKDQTYTGKEICPVPVITYGGKRLKKNTDFTVTYTDNVKVGTAKCKIQGKGDYKGTKTVSFQIVKAGSASSDGRKDEEKATAGKFTVTVAEKTVTWTGKERKPAVTVKVSGKEIESRYYTVTYANNKDVGNAQITVKGKGTYSAYEGSATFKIEPKQAAISSLTSPEAGSLLVKWKKDSQADGYQVQYCTRKAFDENVKTKKVTDGATVSLQIDKLTAGKKYYVRVRSWKAVDGKNWYGPWSEQLDVKV